MDPSPPSGPQSVYICNKIGNQADHQQVSVGNNGSCAILVRTFEVIAPSCTVIVFQLGTSV